MEAMCINTGGRLLGLLLGLLMATALTACGGATADLSVSVTGEGKITSPAGIDCGTRCNTTVKLSGAPPTATGTITLTATAQPDNHLLGWNDPECGQSNNCTITLEQYCAIGTAPLPGCAVWDTNSYTIRPVFVQDSDVITEAWSPYSSCAIYTSGELQCWNRWGVDTQAPTVNNPTQVVTEQAISCVEDNNNVQCWGVHTLPTYYCPPGERFPSDQCETIYPERPPLPALYPPLTLAAGAGFACALDVEGVKCWSGYGDTQVPELFNPTNIRTENRQICVDDAGIKVCWTRHYAPPAT